MSEYTFFVTCARGIEDLLLQELQQLQLEKTEQSYSGVSFEGSLEQAYRVCLWSRLASRVLLKLKQFPAENEDQLYKGVQTVNWSQHLNMNGSLAVNCTISRSKLNNTHYAALKTKDAIVDQFNELYETRPSVDRDNPDVRINLHIHQDQAELSIDLSGEPLHKRGYRLSGVRAPLKENLAAAIIMRSGWQKSPVNLLDPMCGSATFLIEAAMMVLDMAPGLKRDHYGFMSWKGHQAECWKGLLDTAKQRAKPLDSCVLKFMGFDQSRDSIAAARQNVHSAGLQDLIGLEQKSFSQSCQQFAESVDEFEPGMVIVNPPYGERLGEKQELSHLYAEMGECWREHFANWQIALFTSNDDLSRHVGLRAHRSNSFFNGPIKCKLHLYQIRPALSEEQKQKRDEKYQEQRSTILNRLRKNFKHLARWARKNDIHAYRVYDADIPEYSAAVDIYNDWVHVQEYQAPSKIELNRARQRFDLLVDVIPEVLSIDNKQLVVKTRRQQKGLSQYEKQANQKNELQVEEGGLRFSVNLSDYLDTGLFLDHRMTRQMVADIVASQPGLSFLNLFSYTSSVSVYAASQGAVTTSVDMSNTYINWSKRNFELNDLDVRKHQFIKSDCIKWIKQALKKSHKYDLIFIDPPTFSNSKSMEHIFDVQKDHGFLIDSAIKLLTPDGEIIFSNNFRKFKLDKAIQERYAVEDITALTIPEDFKRNQKIHRCYKIKPRATE